MEAAGKRCVIDRWGKRLIVETYSVEETVDLMRQAGIRMSPEKLKLGIQQGVYPFGECVMMNAPQCVIYAKLFWKWMEERGEEVPAV